MWVLGFYKLSWPANGSFVYVIFFFFFFCLFVCLFVCLRRKTGKRGSCGRGSCERGSWGRGRRGYIVLCIHVNILTVMNRKTSSKWYKTVKSLRKY